MTQTETTLLPCPFCGGEADQFASDTYCRNEDCGSIMQATTKAESGRQWNTRTDATTQAEMLRLMKQMAETLQSFVNVADSRPHCPIGHLVEHGVGTNKARSVLVSIEQYLNKQPTKSEEA